VLAGHPDVELFIAMSVFPIFILPLATRRLLAAADRRATARAAAVPMLAPVAVQPAR
jgi:hypothetical protein